MKLNCTELTREVLTRFEASVDVSALRREIADAVEYCAYVACMVYGCGAGGKTWEHFCGLVRKYEGISL